MPLSGTFRYFAVVPNDLHKQASPWPMRMDEPIPPSGDSLFTFRLVGYSPHLYWSNDETALPHKIDGAAIPTIRLTLVAQNKKHASMPKSSFLIARSLFSSMQQGDVLHMARTNCGGLGFSALRDGKLVFAAGAVHAVPLGEGFRTRSPDMSKVGLSHFEDNPEQCKQAIEITVDGESFTGYEGRSHLGEYQVSVLHGYRVSDPGVDECVAIMRDGAGSLEEAEISALLINT